MIFELQMIDVFSASKQERWEYTMKRCTPTPPYPDKKDEITEFPGKENVFRQNSNVFRCRPVFPSRLSDGMVLLCVKELCFLRDQPFCYWEGGGAFFF